MQSMWIARSGKFVIGAVALTLLAGAANADLTGKPLDMIITDADGNVGAWGVRPEHGTWSPDGQTWSYSGATDPRYSAILPDADGRRLININNQFGQAFSQLDLSGFNIVIVQDPVITLNVGVVAGASATNFTITSTLLSFPSISNAIATASASLNVTDRNTNGVTATGLQPGGTFFSAFYNSTGLPATGTNYTNLIAGPLANPGALQTASGSQGVGPDNLGTVVDMSSQWKFTLSARDSAQGTSTFIIVPTPGALALFGVGALIGGRRRR